MACLSKLDRHLKDVEEKLKYIIIIMRKIRRHRVLERQKAKKRHGSGKYTKTEAPMEIFQRYFKNFIPTKSYYFVSFIF